MQGYVNFMSYRGDGNFMCHTKMQDDANVVLLGVMEICCATKEGDGNFMCKMIETTIEGGLWGPTEWMVIEILNEISADPQAVLFSVFA